jgi:hypothetical protein
MDVNKTQTAAHSEPHTHTHTHSYLFGCFAVLLQYSLIGCSQAWCGPVLVSRFQSGKFAIDVYIFVLCKIGLLPITVMKLTCGYLYTSKQLRNDALDSFEKRYFVLYPYCGMQWFIQQPERIVEDDLFEIVGKREDARSNERGWVFGGNVSVSEISVNEAIEVPSVDYSADAVYFPFTLQLVSGDAKMRVKFAAQTVEAMNMWIDGIKTACSNINLVRCFAASNCFPSPEMYSTGLTSDAVHFSNCKLDGNSIQALSTMAEQNEDMISTIRLVNCQLRDHHIRSIGTFIDPGLLLHLSLADNFLTDSGIMELSQFVAQCKRLESIDVSSNFVGDDGMEQLLSALDNCPHLQAFNISRNHLTERSARPLAKHLAKFSSKLKYFNVAYNQLGDGCATVVALLLKNKATQLEHVDISFSGVRDAGLKELALAIAGNKTLKSVNVKGCFAESTVMIPFVECVARCHKQTSKLPISAQLDDATAGMVVKFGALSIQGERIHSLSYKSAKSAFPYVDNCSLLVDACIRRKLQNIFSLDATDYASSPRKSVLVSKNTVPQSPTRALTVPVCIICLRFETSAGYQSPEDIVVHLAVHLNASPNQFKVLSSSLDDKAFGAEENANHPDDDSRIDDDEELVSKVRTPKQLCFVTLLFQNPTSAQQLLHKARLFPKNAAKFSTEVVQTLLCQAGSPQSNLADVKTVCFTLEKWAKASHPVLRALQIRSVFVQQSLLTVDNAHLGRTQSPTTPGSPKPFSPSMSASGAVTGIPQLAPIYGMPPFHCNISKSGLLGRGSADDFVPVLSPTDYATLFDSNSSGYTGSSADIQLQYNYDMWQRLALNDDGIATKYMKDVGALIFGDEDDDDGSEGYTALVLRKSKEHAIARMHARRDRKARSEELICAIRDLRRSEEFDSATAKFWEAALGNVRYRFELFVFLEWIIVIISCFIQGQLIGRQAARNRRGG